jgi:hypothetical protein
MPLAQGEILDYGSLLTCPGAQPGQTLTDIAKTQWRYIGYRGFSRFISSDTDFLIIRQIGTLNARALLALQDQLSTLEAELENLYQKCIQTGNIHNGSFRMFRL